MLLRCSLLIPCTDRSVRRRAAWQRKEGLQADVSSQRRVVVEVEDGQATLAAGSRTACCALGSTQLRRRSSIRAVLGCKLLGRFFIVQNRRVAIVSLI